MRYKISNVALKGTNLTNGIIIDFSQRQLLIPNYTFTIVDFKNIDTVSLLDNGKLDKIR